VFAAWTLISAFITPKPSRQRTWDCSDALKRRRFSLPPRRPGGLLIAEQAPGQRRRLSIARLLAVKRPIWLLDEPASTLDTAGKARLAGFMQSHLAEGGLIVAATHGELEPSAAQELSLDQKNHSRATEALEPAEAAP